MVGQALTEQGAAAAPRGVQQETTGQRLGPYMEQTASALGVLMLVMTDTQAPVVPGV